VKVVRTASVDGEVWAWGSSARRNLAIGLGLGALVVAATSGAYLAGIDHVRSAPTWLVGLIAFVATQWTFLGADRLEVQLAPNALFVDRLRKLQRTRNTVPYTAIREVSIETRTTGGNGEGGQFYSVLVLALDDGSTVEIDRGYELDLRELARAIDERRAAAPPAGGAEAVPEALRQLTEPEGARARAARARARGTE
jgi:hypothetical protein